jgi:CDP-diacylglycerol--serine O-phosphatidyltransferase
MNSYLKNARFLVPNFFTALSLVSGLLALQFTFEEKFVTAAWLIMLSILCDGLDGKLARWLNAYSKFGATFDTLSDFVAFGVVPAFLAYKSYLLKFGFWGIAISFFYIFAGGYRLVRFTLKNTDTNKKHPFIGLPIPAAGGFISSYIILNYYFWHSLLITEISLAVILISSILMISHIEYLPIEKGKKLTRESKLFIVLATVSIIVAIKYFYFVFIIWIITYILYGIVRHFVRYRKNIKKTIN